MYETYGLLVVEWCRYEMKKNYDGNGRRVQMGG